MLVFSAVIIPTLNLYLGSLDASYFYMGFCLSAMSLTSLLSAPIYGRITDVLRTTKVIVIISNIFAISGKTFWYAINLKYFFSQLHFDMI